MEDKSIHKIEDIKKRLYDRRDTVTVRRHEGVLHEIKHDASDHWDHSDLPKNLNDDDLPKPHSSFFKKFFISACVFFVGALLFGVYVYYKGNNIIISNDKIDVLVTGSNFIEGGQELSLQIDVTNKNNASLKLVNLSVEYPRGSADSSIEMTRLPSIEIGTMAAGERTSQNVKVVLYGEEKSIKNILVNLEYQPDNSNAIFNKKIEYPVTISSAPLSLIIDAPKEINANQEIDINVKAILNTKLPGGNTLVQVEYPQGFVFESAVPKPSFGNFMWNIDSITKEKPFGVAIKGKMIGQYNDEQVFRVSIGNKEIGNAGVNIDTIYSTLIHSITLVKPFLETHLFVNNNEMDSYSVNPNNQISGHITWSNNLSVPITDAKIFLNLSGTAFDRTNVIPNDGFFDSKNNRIVWDKESVSLLSSIAPGQKGKVEFTLKPIQSGFGKFLENPEIKLELSLLGKQNIDGINFSDIKSLIKQSIKLNTDFQITSGVNYVSGELPPKVEKETKYKVIWTLSNTNNSLDKAVATSVLPSYMSWIGIVSPVKENVTYNSSTREITWNIGKVEQQTGFKSNREVSFVIAISPSLLQVNSIPVLMKEVNLTGTDLYTGSTITDKYGTVNTLLVNDPNFQYGNERVIK